MSLLVSGASGQFCRPVAQFPDVTSDVGGRLTGRTPKTVRSVRWR